MPDEEFEPLPPEEVMALKSHPAGVAQRRLTIHERILVEKDLLRQWSKDRGYPPGEHCWEDSLDAMDASRNIWIIDL